MAGRPTTLTPEALAEFLQHLENGNYRCAAAKASGFGMRTLQRWIREKSPEAKQFRRAMLKAEGRAETKVVSVLTLMAAEKNAQAGTWYLAHKFPDRWGSQRELVKALEQALKELKAAREREGPPPAAGG